MNTATPKHLNPGDLRLQVARLQELIFDSTLRISESKKNLENLKAKWQRQDINSAGQFNG